MHRQEAERVNGELTGRLISRAVLVGTWNSLLDSIMLTRYCF